MPRDFLPYFHFKCVNNVIVQLISNARDMPISFKICCSKGSQPLNLPPSSQEAPKRCPVLSDII